MKSTILSTCLFLSGVASAAPSIQSRAHQRNCTYAELALATGINLNINGQYSELNYTTHILNSEQQNSMGEDMVVSSDQARLEAQLQAGINIRTFNQQIAPPGNKAIPGLQKYASAQESEQRQIRQLSGVLRYDSDTLQALQEAIMNGIQLNQQNLKDAVSECNFVSFFPPQNETGM